MVVYGVALLAFCMLMGVFLGDLLGHLIGVNANVGGIGIAMLLLIYIANRKNKIFQIGLMKLMQLLFLLHNFLVKYIQNFHMEAKNTIFKHFWKPNFNAKVSQFNPK